MIKWPEPVGAAYTIASVQHCTITEVLPDTNFYTEAQLKQAVRDALDTQGVAKLVEALKACLQCFDEMKGRKPSFVEDSIAMSKEALSKYKGAK